MTPIFDRLIVPPVRSDGARRLLSAYSYHKRKTQTASSLNKQKDFSMLSLVTCSETAFEVTSYHAPKSDKLALDLNKA